MSSKSWITVPIDQEIGDVPTTGYSPYFFPIEGGTALFRFTADEFTQVLSALINGAALTYPDEWIQVVWYFLRSMEFPVSICEQIIACVTSDVDVQNAIAQMLTTNNIFNEYITTTTRGITGGGIAGKLIAGDCDNGVVMGKVIAIVNGMDQANKDWFEKIEVGTNDEEKFALALEAIPVLGELPFDQIIEFLEDILEDFTENYNAQVDSTLLEEWYCGLYCIAKSKPDCSLTYGDIYAYFSGRTTSGLNPFSTLSDVVAFIRTGDFSGGTKVADGMMMLQAGLTTNGREFLGSSLPTISFSTRDAPTSTLWEECEECPETELWLVPVIGPEDSIELVSSDENSQTWVLHNYYTGHYLTGGAVSKDGTPFYIVDVDFNPASTGEGARWVTDFGTFELQDIPCESATTKAWIYNALAEGDVTITINRTGCLTGPWLIDDDGLILEQDATSITLRGVLQGPWYQVSVITPYPVCVVVEGGTATSNDWYNNEYYPCDDDPIEFEVGTTFGPIPGTVRGMHFSAHVPFDVTFQFTQ